MSILSTDLWWANTGSTRSPSVEVQSDHFFIGFAQNVLTPHMGWGTILAYLALFIANHYVK